MMQERQDSVLISGTSLHRCPSHDLRRAWLLFIKASFPPPPSHDAWLKTPCADTQQTSAPILNILANVCSTIHSISIKPPSTGKADIIVKITHVWLPRPSLTKTKRKNQSIVSPHRVLSHHEKCPSSLGSFSRLKSGFQIWY